MALKYYKNVVTLKLNPETCTGCGMCLEVYPHGVLKLFEGKSELFDRDSCMECGACEKNCPTHAIEVNAGVGCASAVIKGILRGTEPTCDCSGELGGSCC